MSLNITCYELPAHWASYLVNADDSGLTSQELSEVVAFLKRENLSRHACLSCADETWFSRQHDAAPEVLACTVTTFHFAVCRPS